MNRLIIATTNAGKVVEIRSALGEIPDWALEPLAPGVPSIEETGDTFLDNAILKAEHYSKFVHGLRRLRGAGQNVLRATHSRISESTTT